MTNRILFCPVGPPQIIAEPAKFEAAQSTRYTDGSVIVEPRKPMFPPHMIQALLVRLRDRCSVAGTPASPAARRHGSSSPRLAEMLADANISAALFITERWSRQPFHPCFAFAIVIFQSLVSSLCAENRLAQVLPCNSTHEAAPANDEAKSRSRGAAITTGSAASDFSGSAFR